jgi:hypothetical protein
MTNILSFVQILIFAGLLGSEDAFFPAVKNESFKRGESLNFKMTYGIFTIGRGTTKINRRYYNLHDRNCFKVEVTAGTVGLLNLVTDIDNQYGAYVDTASLLPLVFYRKQREGDYKKDEQTYFDHPKKTILVQTENPQTGKWNNPVEYSSPSQVRDMISGFLFLRSIDLSCVQVDDTVSIRGFFEDEFYDMNIVYKGKAIINTNLGKIRSLVFKPVMPRNKLFKGENSITAYFSDDKNRIPVKVEANMFIGRAGVELTNYSELRHPLNIVEP